MAPLLMQDFKQYPLLRADGANFAFWYENLRDYLSKKYLLYTIEDPLGTEPGFLDFEWDDFQDRRDNYNEVKFAIIYAMQEEMRVPYMPYDSNEIVFMLKQAYASEVRKMAHRWFRRFHSQMMAENTCLQTHLGIMDVIHKRMTEDLNREMAHEEAIETVLASLPESYHRVVDGYLERNEPLTFHQFLMRIRGVKVAPVGGEVID
jgi:hypothetical protein